MTDKEWYDTLTEMYEFTVVLQPHPGQPSPIAAKYLIGEETRDDAYLTDATERLQVEGWRPLTSEVTEGTRAIMLVREKRGRARKG